MPGLLGLRIFEATGADIARGILGSQMGSQGGANDHSRQAVAGHGQLLFQQLDGLTGDAERCPATLQNAPEKRKVGGSTPPLTTTLTSANADSITSALPPC